LIKQLGGERTPAVGFGIGIERLIIELKKNHPLEKKVIKILFFNSAWRNG